jgi:hypothetical protein
VRTNLVKEISAASELESHGYSRMVPLLAVVHHVLFVFVVVVIIISVAPMLPVIRTRTCVALTPLPLPAPDPGARIAHRRRLDDSALHELETCACMSAAWIFISFSRLLRRLGSEPRVSETTLHTAIGRVAKLAARYTLADSQSSHKQARGRKERQRGTYMPKPPPPISFII